MKRRIAIILSLALLAGILLVPTFAESDARPAPPSPKEDVEVVAVYAKSHAQPIDMPASPEGEETQIMADTLWIYYSDDTFEQYAETPLGYELFSTGAYSFKDDGDFASGDGAIVIERDRKLSLETRTLSDYASSHEYAMGSLGFEQLFGPKDEGKSVAAIFGDEYFLTYTDDSGVVTLLDTVLFFFKDMTFEAFSFMKDDVVLTGSGTYAFDETGDFHILPFEEDNGTITMNYDYSIQNSEPASVTFDLNLLATACFYEAHPAIAPAK